MCQITSYRSTTCNHIWSTIEDHWQPDASFMEEPNDHDSYPEGPIQSVANQCPCCNLHNRYDMATTKCRAGKPTILLDKTEQDLEIQKEKMVQLQSENDWIRIEAAIEVEGMRSVEKMLKRKIRKGRERKHCSILCGKTAVFLLEWRPQSTCVRVGRY